jgi:general secretion pathway protein G
MKRCNRLRARAGFTLIELLAVILIIGLLVGMILGIAHLATRANMETKARVDIELLHTAVVNYMRDVGDVPTLDFPANLSFTNLVAPYLPARFRFTDPWGSYYQYDFIAGKRFKLHSRGADLTSDGSAQSEADDVVAGKF